MELYYPSVIRTEENTLVEVYLEEGLHILTVQVIGRNGASVGFFCESAYLRLLFLLARTETRREIIAIWLLHIRGECGIMALNKFIWI